MAATTLRKGLSKRRMSSNVFKQLSQICSSCASRTKVRLSHSTMAATPLFKMRMQHALLGIIMCVCFKSRFLSIHPVVPAMLSMAATQIWQQLPLLQLRCWLVRGYCIYKGAATARRYRDCVSWKAMVNVSQSGSHHWTLHFDTTCNWHLAHGISSRPFVFLSSRHPNITVDHGSHADTWYDCHGSHAGMQSV